MSSAVGAPNAGKLVVCGQTSGPFNRIIWPKRMNPAAQVNCARGISSSGAQLTAALAHPKARSAFRVEVFFDCPSEIKFDYQQQQQQQPDSVEFIERRQLM